MSLKDIDKLKEKVDRDPLSKLFVPLSEEYKKEGMIDEAINVLLKGIENQPGYMSARVALGKIYLEKEMLKEALNEFEQVTKAIPDNLYAHKKLAEIYRAGGDFEMAIKAYKTVLRLNAMDEEALTSLSELQGTDTEAGSPGPSGDILQVQPEPEEAEAEIAADEDPFQGEAPAEVSPEPVKDDELAAFESSIFGFSDDPAASPEDLLGDKAVTDDFTDSPLEDIAEIEEAEPAFETADETESTDTGDVYEIEETPDEEFQAMFLEPSESDNPQPAPQVDTPPAAPAEIASVTLADADRCISEERYLEAFNVYRTMLAANPGDRRILQRVDDLKQLLKMLGRGRDTVIEQLNNLLEGINKKRDEFYRNT
ncbi:MAG: hypothetical protein HZB33_08345 [Nitrospirae bacterium]|nr:hypothetical protein [Nitrospirota bacterium]